MDQQKEDMDQLKKAVDQQTEVMDKLLKSIDESNARMRQLTENVSGTVISDLAGVVDPTRMVGRETVWWLC